jgi:hypothetical protein
MRRMPIRYSDKPVIGVMRFGLERFGQSVGMVQILGEGKKYGFVGFEGKTGYRKGDLGENGEKSRENL